MMDPHDVEARYVPGCRIRLRLHDGRQGGIDLEDGLEGPVSEPLRDMKEFREVQAHAGCHTLVWPNEADLAPEFLRERVRMTTRSAR